MAYREVLHLFYFAQATVLLQLYIAIFNTRHCTLQFFYQLLCHDYEHKRNTNQIQQFIFGLFSFLSQIAKVVNDWFIDEIAKIK